MALSFDPPAETSFSRLGPFTVGKKNDKNKDKKKRKDEDRPGRKDLVSRVEELQAENEALRARLERIAEIAAAPADLSDSSDTEVVALVDGQTT